MTVDTRGNVIAAYRTRRTELLHEAQQAEMSRRQQTANRLRAAALLLSRAISDEIVDDIPSGIERPLR